MLLKDQVFWDVTLCHLVTTEYMAALFAHTNSCNPAFALQVIDKHYAEISAVDGVGVDHSDVCT